MTPDEVLNKPGKLTDEEFDVMRQHVVHSHDIPIATAGITPPCWRWPPTITSASMAPAIQDGSRENSLAPIPA